MTSPGPAQFAELQQQARAAREQAHAPYSGFRVGAAVLAGDGRIYAGCNVENLSFGLTVCAERNAIAAAVAGGMRLGELAAIVIIGDTQQPISPCGACRQVLAEFAHADCLVRGLNLHGASRDWHLDELLPDGFTATL
jgi:cytidine deaminase